MRRGDGVGARAHRRAQRAHQRDRRRPLGRGVEGRRAQGSGGGRRRAARTPARGPGHRQGERRRRRTAHHERAARVRGSRRSGPLSGSAQPARCRRGHRGPHQHSRALDARNHRQPVARPDLQSVGRGGVSGRLFRRGVGGHRDGVRPDPSRKRHRRLAAVPVVRVRGCHGEADLRASARVQPERIGRAGSAGTAHLRAGRDLPRSARRAAGNAGAGRRRPARSVVGTGPRSTDRRSMLPSGLR